MGYFKNLLIAVDQLGTALIGGYPDETLSSFAYRMSLRGGAHAWPQKAIDSLFFWQPHHCLGAYLAERRRTQLPPVLRDQLKARSS